MPKFDQIWIFQPRKANGISEVQAVYNIALKNTLKNLQLIALYWNQALCSAFSPTLPFCSWFVGQVLRSMTLLLREPKLTFPASWSNTSSALPQLPQKSKLRLPQTILHAFLLNMLELEKSIHFILTFSGCKHGRQSLLLVAPQWWGIDALVYIYW